MMLIVNDKDAYSSHRKSHATLKAAFAAAKSTTLISQHSVVTSQSEIKNPTAEISGSRPASVHTHRLIASHMYHAYAYIKYIDFRAFF